MGQLSLRSNTSRKMGLARTWFWRLWSYGRASWKRLASSFSFSQRLDLILILRFTVLIISECFHVFIVVLFCSFLFLLGALYSFFFLNFIVSFKINSSQSADSSPGFAYKILHLLLGFVLRLQGIKFCLKLSELGTWHLVELLNKFLPLGFCHLFFSSLWLSDFLCNMLLYFLSNLKWLSFWVITHNINWLIFGIWRVDYHSFPLFILW